MHTIAIIYPRPGDSYRNSQSRLERLRVSGRVVEPRQKIERLRAAQVAAMVETAGDGGDTSIVATWREHSSKILRRSSCGRAHQRALFLIGISTARYAWGRRGRRARRARRVGAVRRPAQRVVPLYYDRDRDGLPREWIAASSAPSARSGWRFSADRMVMDYVLNAYIPGAGGPAATCRCILPRTSGSSSGSGAGDLTGGLYGWSVCRMCRSDGVNSQSSSRPSASSSSVQTSRIRPLRPWVGVPRRR